MYIQNRVKHSLVPVNLGKNGLPLSDLVHKIIVGNLSKLVTNGSMHINHKSDLIYI